MQKYIMVKATEQEKEQLKKDAHRHEKNISDYIRWLIDKQRKEDESNGVHIR
jgi:hypothetical protein